MPRMLLVVIFLCSGLMATAQDLGQSDMIRIGVLKNGSYEIVTLPLETYVARVLTGEALPGSAPAAYEALAIAIRTYTIANRHKHRADGFDLCDQTHCQVMRASTPVTERAALATAGQVLLYHGTPATVYYSASCGGRTEKPSNVWPGAEDVPYLPSRADDGCGGVPEWSTELALNDLQRALQAAGFRGSLRNVRIGSRNESGRAAELVLDGLTPGTISGQDLRAAIGRTLGWQYLQSTAFELERTPAGFRFRGHGNGHGVGMCVIGSTKLATAGESAPQILQRYFPGTEIGRVGPRLTAVPPETPRITSSSAPRLTAPPGAAAAAPPANLPSDVAVSLPEGDEGERAVIAQMVVRARDEIMQTLAIPVAPRVALRFHPTTAAYERATGRPWFTLGAVVGTELHFVPLAVLREGGILERTIRHQLVHALADAAFTGRPVWVREGAALHYSEGRNGPGNRGSCPLDAEFVNPVSIGALGDVYSRARACFERQLSVGRAWRDIR
jgi:SpoIID/LytB domain protein